MARAFTFIIPIACFGLCVDAGAAEPKRRIAIKQVSGAPKVAAKKRVKTIVVQVKDAADVASQAVVIRGGYQSGATSQVRTEVDPKDNNERFLILAPGGPILIEAALLLDGQPFRMAREKIVDERLKIADSDGDGKKTWKEAIADGRFISSRYAYQLRTPAQRNAFIKRNDRNKDGLVDRAEVRMLIAQTGGGAAFQVTANRGNQPDVKKILDKDKDGRLNKSELAKAGKHLQSLDANDNDLLETSEFGGVATAGRQYVFDAGRRPTATSRSSAAHLLGPAANLVAVYNAIKSKYGKNGTVRAENFPLFPKLLKELDLNNNGELDSGEVIGFHLLQPHIVLEVNLGKGGKRPVGIAVKSLASELGNQAVVQPKFTNQLTLTLPGFKAQFSVNNSTRARANYGATAKRMLTQYDSNKNGYLEKKELTNQYYQRMFASWDTDRDGKVFAKEIQADYDRQQAPLMSRLAAGVTEHGPTLFAVLDTSGDNRLSLREMRTVGQRLLALDKDGDGLIATDEMPERIDLSFSRGNAYAYYGRGVVAVSSGGRIGTRVQQSRPPQGPKWFVHMDRNGDGDVTQREFLGTPQQFKKIDTNGDGFIEPKEAQAASTGLGKNADK